MFTAAVFIILKRSRYPSTGEYIFVYLYNGYLFADPYNGTSLVYPYSGYPYNGVFFNNKKYLTIVMT